MKSKLLVFSLLAIISAAVLFVTVGFVDPDAAPRKEQINEGEVNIKLPHKLSFASERVPLEYFDVRESLERELISNSYFHSQTIFLLKRINRYLPIIEPILEQYNIPEDFKYLAVAESILNDKAKSPVGAAGIWQLMKGTAQDYGLEVNANVDERYNLELSTHAACKYLLESYEKYENWTLVAASYNLGRRALDRSMTYQKQDDYYNMYLNTETARYVFRILAFKLIVSEPEKYGFDLTEKDNYPVFEHDTIHVNYPIEHLADFADAHGMTYKTLKIFNPWLLENKLNNASAKAYKVLKPQKNYRKQH